MKILFIYSSLAEKGPTKQLLYLTTYLMEHGHSPTILTLSPEGKKSISHLFDENKIPWLSLNLTRFRGLFFAKKSIKDYLNKQNFDLIHTHGLRPDSLLSSIQSEVPHIITIRNVPWIDYPMKFGKYLGHLMSKYHLYVLKKCKYNVACSSSIYNSLLPVLSQLNCVRNGVLIPEKLDKLMSIIQRKLSYGWEV